MLEAQEDGVSRDLWVRLDVGLGLTFSALADYAEARRVLRDADRRVGGEHGRPSALWIGWGVLDTLQNETPEMQMNARDAFVHLAEDPDLSAAGAANLAQVADALQAFAHAAGDQVLDRPSRILLTITRARVAALTGVPLSAVLEMVQSLQADISALSDDVRRLTLQRLLADLVELKKFV